MSVSEKTLTESHKEAQAERHRDPQKLIGLGARLIHEFSLGAATTEVSDQAGRVSRGRATIDGITRETLFMHPSSSVAFLVSGATVRFECSVAILPDAWEKASGVVTFEVLVDGVPVAGGHLDVRECSWDRRWVDLSVDLPASKEPTRTLTLRTRAPGSSEFAWAVFGDPRLVPPGGSDLRIDWERFDRLATHKDNLSFNLYREVMYWNRLLRAGANGAARDRLDAASMGIKECPGLMIGLVEDETKRLGRKPRVLDFGSGPLSTLAYLHHAGLAEVTAADTLSEEYEAIYRLHGIDWKLVPEQVSGEFLREKLGEEAFDIVFVANALDHTQAPALSWMNLFHVARVGGLMVHTHSIREATKLKFDQLHKYDLYPRDRSLWIEDAHGNAFSLTDDLPLEALPLERTLVVHGEWFQGAYRKLAREVSSASFLTQVLEQLKGAFATRSRWAFEVENLLETHVDLAERFDGPPYGVSKDRM